MGMAISALLRLLDGPTPIWTGQHHDICNTVRDSPLSSASFCLFSYRCEMCIMACTLSLTEDALPPFIFHLNYPLENICPPTRPQRLRLYLPLICNNLDFTTFASCVRYLIFISLLKRFKTNPRHHTVSSLGAVVYIS